MNPVFLFHFFTLTFFLSFRLSVFFSFFSFSVSDFLSVPWSICLPYLLSLSQGDKGDEQIVGQRWREKLMMLLSYSQLFLDSHCLVVCADIE